ncbi:MAG: PAS domain S-box protein, partial [Roseinatronobacter sp.]
MLHDLSLLDTDPEIAFDDLTTLSARFLAAPIALFTLVDEAGARQFFKSHAGLPEPVATARQTPLSRSFCKLVSRSGEKLRVVDARRDARVSHNPIIQELGVIAYLGQPVHAPDGSVIGTLCVIDTTPRDWTAQDEDTLLRLSHMVSTHLKLRRAHGALKAEHAYFSGLLETLPVGVSHVDAQGRVIFNNAMAQQILGLSDPQHQPRRYDDTAWKITTLDGAPFPSAALPVARVLAGEDRVTDVVHAIEHPDGRRRVLSVNAAATRRSADDTAVLCTISDATDRIAADQALREREALFATLTDLAPFGIAITDLDTGEILQVNQSLLDQSGYTRDEFLRLRYADIAVPLHAHELQEVLTLLRDTGAYPPVERVFLRKDGAQYPVRCRGKLIPKRGGRTLVCHFVEDIAQERAQIDLLERLGDVAQYTKNIVVITDCKARITWVNPAFEAKTGWTLAEVRGRKPGTFLQCPETDPATNARIRARLRALQPVQEELLNVTRDGTHYWLQIDIQPRFDAQGTHIGFIAVQADVTDYRRHEDILNAVAGFSGRLLTTESLRTERDQMLAEVGAAAGVGRAYALQFDHPIRIGAADAEITVSQISEWCADGIAPRNDRAHLQHMVLRAQGLDAWERILAQGQALHVADIAQTTGAARAFLEREGVKALFWHP